MHTNVFWISPLKRSGYSDKLRSISPPCARVLSLNAFAFNGPGKAGSGSRAGNVLNVPETRKLSKLLSACQKVFGVNSKSH